jgi:iron(III) transport system ATP-binding protein
MRIVRVCYDATMLKPQSHRAFGPLATQATATTAAATSRELTLDALCVRYASQAADAPAVKAVSLRLQAGEIGVLLGPSGCGKTSLLRAIAGFVPLESGSIQVGGAQLAGPGLHLPPEARQVGVVFQDFALFPHLNVADNVAFGLRKLARSPRAARVAEMLELVDLTAFSAQFPHELSGGQQQRVALARALAPAPTLMLLDEPFSSLDAELRERLATEVRTILKRAGTTALVVTHDQLEAFAMGDAVGVMNKGTLEQWDTPYNLYHRPNTRFVADFIGHAALVDGTARRQGEHYSVTIELGALEAIDTLSTNKLTSVNSARLNLPSAQASVAHNGPSLWLGAPLADGTQTQCQVLLRADDIVHDDASALRAAIVRKAFRGSSFLYTLKLPSGAEVLSLVPSHHDHAIGEQIGIRLEVDHLITFSVEMI